MMKVMAVVLALWLCNVAEAVDYTTNHIQNGDFLIGELVNGQIQGWKTYWEEGEIQGTIQNGKNLNSNWESGTKVIELNVLGQNAIYQSNPQLDPCGYSKIQFQYAASQGGSDSVPARSKFKVIFNGNLVDQITPNDFYVHSYTAFVIGKKKNSLQFVGLGTYPGFGVTISNVKLFRAPKPQ